MRVPTSRGRVRRLAAITAAVLVLAVLVPASQHAFGASSIEFDAGGPGRVRWSV